MQNPFTEHPRATGNSQTYWEHGRFAIVNSVKLIYYGILGVIHGIFPFWFKFSTSNFIIKVFKIVVDSGRHTGELKTLLPKGFLDKKYLKKHDK